MDQRAGGEGLDRRQTKAACERQEPDEERPPSGGEQSEQVWLQVHTESRVVDAGFFVFSPHILSLLSFCP
ncbi:hypothetical protein MU1_45210 [Paenibacillus glycanilyticus]|uniref:Uncharacterized protein n=1 Tax=Paenibacillus glycanilyticus TaxID=126569 RepID=A0ABQ6GIU4_9BACL|nr:hypothetical protein MU1_45210 [Paenibacillus glycanilyticus]